MYYNLFFDGNTFIAVKGRQDINLDDLKVASKNQDFYKYIKILGEDYKYCNNYKEVIEFCNRINGDIQEITKEINTHMKNAQIQKVYNDFVLRFKEVLDKNKAYILFGDKIEEEI